jgi:peroxiredoxin Q/BCP
MTIDIQRIPNFRLPASTGQTLERDAYVGKVPLVIFFLPGIDEPVDRDQIRRYDELLSEFGRERSQPLGVARATARELRDLSDEMGLRIPLLADAGGEMARDFDVLDPDGAPRRVTVLGDTDGRVVRVFDPASPDGQADAMLTAVRELDRGELGVTASRGTEPPG